MKIKIKKIKDFFKGPIRVLGENAFLSTLLFIFLSLILGVLVYFNYINSTQKAPLQITKEPAKFKTDTYDEILKVWQEREEKSEEINLKQYPNIFH